MKLKTKVIQKKFNKWGDLEKEIVICEIEKDFPKEKILENLYTKEDLENMYKKGGFSFYIDVDIFTDYQIDIDNNYNKLKSLF